MQKGEIDLDEIILSWPSGGLRERSHLWWEIAEAFRRGEPLKPYEAVPGCTCIRCTGVIPKPPTRSQGLQTSITDDQIARARSYPIVDALEELGCRPTKRGSRVMALCPLHQDTRPSTDITPGKNLWYCFVCAEGGDVIKLWMAAKRVSFADAVRALS
jgi:hypothetical protein